MRILLFGRTGQLGWELERSLATFGDIITLDYPEVDFCKIKELLETTSRIQPDMVINAAAYTDVDKAESEVEKSRMINGIAPAELNTYSVKHHIPFIHYSTDYVFDGMKGSPYMEEDAPHPLNEYGSTKLAGEKGIQDVGGMYLIFRTSWVFSTRKGGFVSKVLEWSRTQGNLRIVSDQVANPTWARMLADATSRIADRFCDGPGDWRSDIWGLYHLAGSGFCSRYDWAINILKNTSEANGQKSPNVYEALSKEFPTPAIRPAFSALDCSKFENMFGFSLPDWKIATQLAMGE